jgi:hypothetical protein
MRLAHTSLHKSDGVGSYIVGQRLYNPMVLAIELPCTEALTLMNGHLKTPMVLARTSLYGQCTAYPHGRYNSQVWGGIGLALTLMFGQCTTYPYGSYIGHWIMEMPWWSAFTLVYHGCRASPHGSYIGPLDYESPLQTGSYNGVWPMYCQPAWLLHWALDYEITLSVGPYTVVWPM